MFSGQIVTNFFIFILSLSALVTNRRSIIITIMCIELMLLSLNLNFVVLSIYLDDVYGQLFSLFILTVAAAESAIGLALIIVYHRVRGSIVIDYSISLKN